MYFIGERLIIHAFGHSLRGALYSIERQTRLPQSLTNTLLLGVFYNAPSFTQQQ